MDRLVINPGNGCSNLVEVVTLNHKEKIIQLLVHIPASKLSADTLQAKEVNRRAQEMCEQHARTTCRYLGLEGFIPTRLQGWRVHTSAISHDNV